MIEIDLVAWDRTPLKLAEAHISRARFYAMQAEAWGGATLGCEEARQYVAWAADDLIAARKLLEDA